MKSPGTALITSHPLDISAIAAAVADDANGANAFFVGTVRTKSGTAGREGEVLQLEYEAYIPMAEKEMEAIVAETMQMFGVTSVVVHHRIGVLPVGEVAVIVGVGAPHRAESFTACRYVIEELKKRVPIWKKEVFKDGAVWVDPHP